MSIQLPVSDQQQLLFYHASSQKITIFSLTSSLLSNFWKNLTWHK